ncbi:flavin reductase family protein [Gordonia sp. NPDC003376]
MSADSVVASTGVPRSVMAAYPSGVVAICAEVDGIRHALVASSFMVGVSETPPLASVSVQHSSQTWKHINTAAHLGISVLSDEHGELCRRLSSTADRDHRLRGVDIHGDEGAIFVQGAPLWFGCHVHDVVPAGDHDLVLLHIDSFRERPEAAPLLFYRSGFTQICHHPESVTERNSE